MFRPEIDINPAGLTVDVNLYDANTFKTGFGIHNTGCDTLSWTISGHEDCQWMDIYPEQGTSEGEENQVTVIFDVNFLYNPYYSHTLTVQDSNAGNSPQFITVHVNVLRPQIIVNPAAITVDVNVYDPNTFKTGFSIQNTGYHTLSWSISDHEDCQWMDIYPEEGTSEGEENQVTVIFDVNFLFNPSYTHTLIVQDPNAGNSPQTLTINVNVLRPGIYTSNSYIEFEMHVGDSNITTASFDIQNSGNGVLNWTITGFEDCNWLSAYPVSGQSTGEVNEVSLSVDVKGMDFGFYTCELIISDPNASNSPQIVTVTLNLLTTDQVYVPSDYPTIQEAIDFTTDGAEVIIEPGIYTGVGNYNINFSGKAITVRSIDPNDPNIVASTVIDASSIDQSIYHEGFMFHSGEDTNSALLGLSITGFKYRPISIFWSRPFIGKCKIFGNAKGIVANYSDSEKLETLISDCVISNNAGPGITINEKFGDSTCNMTIENCQISYNKRSGLVLGPNCDWVYIYNCSIIGNGRDSGYGGGINSYCNLFIENSVIAGNYSAYYGSAIYFGQFLTLRNCTLFGNYTDMYVISCNYSNYSADIENCIIYGNYPDSKIRFSGYSYNLISFCNIEGDINSIQLDDGAILHWHDNINCDPSFTIPGYWDANGTPEDVNDDFWINGDYHLKSQAGRWDVNSETWVQDYMTSACIDAGDPNSDKIGELWPHGLRINMGAYGGTPEASMSLSDAGNIADLNWDGSAGYADMIFIGKWLYEGILLAEDFDRNGFVNFTDFVIFADNWEGSPGLASNPNPVDGARLDDTDADLSWSAGFGASSHDVYFGTSNPPPFIGNQTSTTFDPGLMSRSKYYWRIDEVNTGGKSTGATWFFRTGIPPPP